MSEDCFARGCPRTLNLSNEMVLGAVINGGAEAIVTFNVQDFRPAAAVFNLRILTPAEILLEIRKG